MDERPVITLDNIAVRLRDRLFLQGTSWQICRHENWAVLGPNGSGKSTLARALFGGVPVVRGRVIRHGREGEGPNRRSIAYVSPELHREIMDREDLLDSFRDFSGKTDEATLVRDMVQEGLDEREREEGGGVQDRAREMGIDRLLDRGIASLSTGEMRKALMLRALLKRPELLILDEPFDGLDADSRDSLAGLIGGVVRRGVQIVLITHRPEEVLPEITDVLFLKSGRILLQAKKEEALRSEHARGLHEERIKTASDFPFALRKGNGADASRADRGRLSAAAPACGPILIRMRDVAVRYGGVAVLDGLDWVMRRGENWAILGPNGAGKTTLVELIVGDNLQAYANRIRLFGREKGSGESVWDIKRRIGVVASELQVKAYPEDMNAFEAVCSGFYDSFGLYRRCTEAQKERAKEWLRLFGIAGLADRNFGRLSYGQRQMVLIARAMVKSPDLLILDEPCDGLDGANRAKVLAMAEWVGSRTETDLLYITHQEKEILPCITNVMRLARGKVVEMGALKDQGVERKVSPAGC